MFCYLGEEQLLYLWVKNIGMCKYLQDYSKNAMNFYLINFKRDDKDNNLFIILSDRGNKACLDIEACYCRVCGKS